MDLSPFATLAEVLRNPQKRARSGATSHWDAAKPLPQPRGALYEELPQALPAAPPQQVAAALRGRGPAPAPAPVPAAERRLGGYAGAGELGGMEPLAGMAGVTGEIANNQMVMQDLAEQMGEADRLRDDPAQNYLEPQGRTTGRVFTAAHPLEFLAQGIRQYQGTKKARKGDEAAAQVMKERRTAREDMKTSYGRLSRQIARAMGVPDEEAPDQFKPPSNR